MKVKIDEKEFEKIENELSYWKTRCLDIQNKVVREKYDELVKNQKSQSYSFKYLFFNPYKYVHYYLDPNTNIVYERLDDNNLYFRPIYKLEKTGD